MSLPASKPTRNADYRHAQSLGRQRKAAGIATPGEQAASIASVIRKRLSEGQPLPNLNEYNLSDDVWSELCGILTSDELAEVNVAHADAVSDVYNPEPQQTPHVAQGWRDHEPPIVHSLKWRDADGIEHLHVIRADTLDEALVHVKKLKLCIAAARAKSPSQAPDIKEPGSVSSRRCAIHDTEMTRRVSKRTGKLYSAHDTAEGLCFGRKA